MNRRRISTLAVTGCVVSAVALFCSLDTAAAKGPYIKIVVARDDPPQRFEVRSGPLLGPNALMWTRSEVRVVPAVMLGTRGYLIKRYQAVGPRPRDVALVDSLRYFPNPAGVGFVRYEGALGVRSSLQGRIYLADTLGERVFAELLSARQRRR